MDVSWTWLVVGLVLGVPLGLLVMGAFAVVRAKEAQGIGWQQGYNRGKVEEQARSLSLLNMQNQLWDAREQKWTAMVLELSATVEKFNPAKMANGWHECPPEVERTLAAVDLGKGATS